MPSPQPALRIAAVGLAVHLALVAAALVNADGNPQWFVHFGRDNSGLPLARQLLGSDLLVPHDDGHDGQAFWLLARDPLLLGGRATAEHLDRPAYRSQRVAYPALASVWRVGGEHALLWGLVVTNLAAVFTGGYVATLLALDLGAPPRSGMAFALCPGVLMATMLDVADALALAALLAALLAVHRVRAGWAVAAGVLAVLAKEPSLLGLAGVAALAPGLSRRDRVALVAVPAIAVAGWAMYVRWRLGWPPSGVQEFGLPFAGYVDAVRVSWRRWAWDDMAGAVVAVAALFLTVAVVWRWWVRRSLFLSAAVPFVLLVPFFTAQVLDLPHNLLRAVAPAITLLVLDAYAAAASVKSDRGPGRAVATGMPTPYPP